MRTIVQLKNFITQGRHELDLMDAGYRGLAFPVAVKEAWDATIDDLYTAQCELDALLEQPRVKVIVTSLARPQRVYTLPNPDSPELGNLIVVCHPDDEQRVRDIIATVGEHLL